MLTLRELNHLHDIVIIAKKLSSHSYNGEVLDRLNEQLDIATSIINKEIANNGAMIVYEVSQKNGRLGLFATSEQARAIVNSSPCSIGLMDRAIHVFGTKDAFGKA